MKPAAMIASSVLTWPELEAEGEISDCRNHFAESLNSIPD